MRFPLKMAAFVLPALAAACTAMPTGPGVMVLPSSSRSFAQFRADDMECRNFALESIGGVSPSQAATESGVGSAVVGTVVGAAAGAAIGGQEGAAVGAAPGSWSAGWPVRKPRMSRATPCSIAMTSATSNACTRRATRFPFTAVSIGNRGRGAMCRRPRHRVSRPRLRACRRRHRRASPPPESATLFSGGCRRASETAE